MEFEDFLDISDIGSDHRPEEEVDFNLYAIPEDLKAEQMLVDKQDEC